MRWLVSLLYFLPCLAWTTTQYQQMTFTIPAAYTLSPTNAQLLCSSMYGQLTTEALNNIERLNATPYSCQLGPDKKSLIIQFTLKNT